MPAQKIRIGYVPDYDQEGNELAPSTEHELVLTAGDQVRAVDYEKNNRPDDEAEANYMIVGMYAAFLSARRAHLKHTRGENLKECFENWMDHVYDVPDEDEDPVKAAFIEANKRLTDAGLEPVVIDGGDEGEGEATPLQPS